ncbi:MAG: helix-turn-helix transcriptional regulator [Bacteroidales bacterium]|nr:helix-turn-helix transcriptional regulator [Bacteroidales bacterium]
MYTLKEAWVKMHGAVPFEGWDGRMYCERTDAEITFRANRTQGFMSAYTFTLVLEGWLTVVYNGKELTLHENDLYIYSSGMGISILKASEDYRGICLLVDEHLTFETDTVRDMVRIAYLPIVRLHEPRIALSPAMASHFENRMGEIAGYLSSSNTHKSAIVQYLYSIFLLDLQNAMEQTVVNDQVPKRTEDVFIGFIRLLPDHFVEHHDISFYASSLSISTTYLSRVVKQVTGRTVIDYVNQFLVMEATFLLRTSDLSIAQISDRLYFSDQAAFSKFFSRLQGVSPKDYRMYK